MISREQPFKPRPSEGEEVVVREVTGGELAYLLAEIAASEYTRTRLEERLVRRLDAASPDTLANFTALDPKSLWKLVNNEYEKRVGFRIPLDVEVEQGTVALQQTLIPRDRATSE